MVEIEGEFSGEIKIDPIKYSKILMRSVIKSNDSGAKISVPHEHIGETVVVLFPINRKKKGSVK